jgi:hypothetical protein
MAVVQSDSVTCLSGAGRASIQLDLVGINGYVGLPAVSDMWSLNALFSATRTFEKQLPFSARAVGKGSEQVQLSGPATRRRTRCELPSTLGAIDAIHVRWKL